MLKMLSKTLMAKSSLPEGLKMSFCSLLWWCFAHLNIGSLLSWLAVRGKGPVVAEKVPEDKELETTETDGRVATVETLVMVVMLGTVETVEMVEIAEAAETEVDLDHDRAIVMLGEAKVNVVGELRLHYRM
jgi:hypothetical protein